MNFLESLSAWWKHMKEPTPVPPRCESVHEGRRCSFAPDHAGPHAARMGTTYSSEPIFYWWKAEGRSSGSSE
jgi:hypothetical protein